MAREIATGPAHPAIVVDASGNPVTQPIGVK